MCGQVVVVTRLIVLHSFKSSLYEFTVDSVHFKCLLYYEIKCTLINNVHAKTVKLWKCQLNKELITGWRILYMSMIRKTVFGGTEVTELFISYCACPTWVSDGCRFFQTILISNNITLIRQLWSLLRGDRL